MLRLLGFQCAVPCENEQKVRQAVEKSKPRWVHSVCLSQLNQASLRSSANTPGHMALRNEHRSAGDNEVLERRQFIIHLIEFGLDPINMMIMDELETRDRDFSAQVEDSMLQTIKERAKWVSASTVVPLRCSLTSPRCAFNSSMSPIAHAGVSFGHSRPVSQACLTAISSPGVYLRQSLAHELLEFETTKVYVIYRTKA